MSPPPDGSKKELVLSLARKDPFLRVDEIARRVGTTAPYVRTILSEGRVSLGHLRKAYARDMERRLGADSGGKRSESPAWSFDDFCAGAESIGPIRVEDVVGEDARRALAEWELGGEPPLIRAGRAYRSQGGIEYLHSVTTCLELSVDPRDAFQGNGFFASLGLKLSASIAVGPMTISVDVADPAASAALVLPAGAPVLAFHRVWGDGRKIVVVEGLTFRVDDVRLVFRGTLGAVDLERRTAATGGSATGGEWLA